MNLVKIALISMFLYKIEPEMEFLEGQYNEDMGVSDLVPGAI